VRKLSNRAPDVLAGEPITLEEQLAQWEERKATEKTRNSSMDDVPTGQPALALTQKVYQRVVAAGLPEDLIPDGLATIAVGLGDDAENTLRSATLEFMDTIRKVEQAVAASRRGDDVPEALDVSQLGVVTEDEWRAHWPTARTEPEAELEPEDDEADETDESDEAQVEVEPGEGEPVDEEAEPEEAGEPEADDDPDDQPKSVEPQ
jgi:XTP/dITP diphosphohydrolase